MKLVKPKAEILVQEPGLQGIYKQIELAGRTCYKSEDKITEDSAKGFVNRMIKSGHTAMLEAGTVYLWNPIDDENFEITRDKYSANKYSEVRIQGQAITTNYRVLVENNWIDDLTYLCEPTEYHEKRTTFKLLTSIGVTRELNRHRVNSIAEQSTRYCNYSKDKFGNEITFCIPAWLTLNPGTYELKHLIIERVPDNYFVGDDYLIPVSDDSPENKFIMRRMSNEQDYLVDINSGLQPQQARENLPLCTATEIIHTAFDSDWKHFFDLRYFEKTGKVHPNMKQLTTLMYEEYSNRKN